MAKPSKKNPRRVVSDVKNKRSQHSRIGNPVSRATDPKNVERHIGTEVAFVIIVATFGLMLLAMFSLQPTLDKSSFDLFSKSLDLGHFSSFSNSKTSVRANSIYHSPFNFKGEMPRMVNKATSEEPEVSEESTSCSSPDGSRINYDKTVWPTDNHIIASPFGFKLNYFKGNSPDFHRGVDIAGTAGDAVYSIADGVVYDVYYEGQKDHSYASGGNVIVVQHEMDIPMCFHGNEYNTYYSLYMHLDSIEVEKGQDVAAGTKIATLGQSGKAYYENLHLETRVGSLCSIEYQISNVGSSCSLGFDPHVNPLNFLVYDDKNSLKAEVLAQDPLIVYVTSDSNELDFNSILVTTDDGQRSLVDMDARYGVNIKDLSNPTYEDMTARADEFSAETLDLGMDYGVVFIFENLNEFKTIEVADIWGNEVTLEG